MFAALQGPVFLHTLHTGLFRFFRMLVWAIRFAAAGATTGSVNEMKGEMQMLG